MFLYFGTGIVREMDWNRWRAGNGGVGAGGGQLVRT